MPWYRRKLLWMSLLTLAATLYEHFYGLPLSKDVKAALLTVIQALIEALTGQPLG
jgi:hypothetical protein